MAINSKIILSKGIRLDKEYRNVLTYTTEQLLTVMRDNFHLIYEASNYSFINEFQNIICVQVPYGDCVSLNYMAFQNPRYNNKWFFCFIDKIEYNSEKSTNITFHTDVWSTWYNDFEFKNCYVIREHVSNDTIGLHTVDEGISVPDVMSQQADTQAGLGSYFYIGVLTNWNLDSQTGFNGITIYNRGVFGSKLCLFLYNDTSQLDQLLYFILQTNAEGHAEDIKEIFIIPSSLIEASQLEVHYYDVVIGGQTLVTDAYYYTISTYDFNAKEFDWEIDKTHSFTDYTPKNNKLFCYPYNYLYVTNNVGDSNVLRYEDFIDSTNKAKFKIQLALSVGCSGRLIPYRYKNVTENIDESISLGKYPVCQWSTDAYTNWLTQNAVNIQTSFLKSGIKAISGGLSMAGATTEVGVGMGAVNTLGSLAVDIANMAGAFYQAQLLPNKTNGANTGDVNLASNDNTFKAIHMRAKTEYLRQIDDYFSRFGYKILRVKIPEINSRTYWNYVQIGHGETLVVGYVPQEALDTINKIAERGITIWHNHDNIGNYQLNNTIVS